MTLEDALLTTGILQQDVVRLVLEDEPKKRYQHMASLLGLHELSRFEDEIKNRNEVFSRSAADARTQHAEADSQARSAESELQILQARLAAQPELTAVRDALTKRLDSEAPAILVTELPWDLGTYCGFRGWFIGRGAVGRGRRVRALRVL